MNDGQCVARLFEVGAKLVVQLIVDRADVDVGKDVPDVFGLETRANQLCDATRLAAIHDYRVHWWEQSVALREAVSAEQQRDQNNYRYQRCADDCSDSRSLSWHGFVRPDVRYSRQ